MVWLHTQIFPQNLRPLTRPCANEKQLCMLCLYQTHVAKFPLRKSHRQPRTSYCGLHSSGLQIGGNLRMLYRGCRMDGVTLPSQILWRLPESSNSCATLNCRPESWFLLYSCESELAWNASGVCQRPVVGVGFDCLPSRGIHKIYSSLSHKTVIMTLLTDRGFWIFFFSRERKTVPFHGLPFHLRFKMVDSDLYFKRPTFFTKIHFKNFHSLN